MADFKNSIDQFINALGGTVAVAKEHRVGPSVVSSWRKTGKVPNWRVPRIVELALAKGVPLPEDLTTGRSQ